MNTSEIITSLAEWFDPRYIAAGASFALVLVVAWLAGKAIRATRNATTPLEDTLTWIVAGVTTGVSAQGMWVFFGEVMHFPTLPRIVCSSFLEFAMLVSALRAKKHAKHDEQGRGGVDEKAVWVLSAATGALSAMHALINARYEEAAVRIVAPFAAAWLWKRGLKIAHRIRKGVPTQINYRFSLERVLVALRLAEPRSRTASDIDTHRRLNRVARAAKKLRVLQENGAKPSDIEKASAHLDRVMDAANEHTGLASNPGVREQLMDQVAVLFNTSYLAQAEPVAPWDAPVPDLPAVTLTAPPPIPILAAAKAEKPAPEPADIRSAKPRLNGKKADAREFFKAHRNITGEALAIRFGASKATGCRWLAEFKEEGAPA